jgi:hypothetical protein
MEAGERQQRRFAHAVALLTSGGSVPEPPPADRGAHPPPT